MEGAHLGDKKTHTKNDRTCQQMSQRFVPGPGGWEQETCPNPQWSPTGGVGGCRPLEPPPRSLTRFPRGAPPPRLPPGGALGPPWVPPPLGPPWVSPGALGPLPGGVRGGRRPPRQGKKFRSHILDRGPPYARCSMLDKSRIGGRPSIIDDR